MIYLDYQATTPLAPEAREAMLEWLGPPSNPHSATRYGRAGAAAIAVAREHLLALLPEGGKLYFTGSATEAINLAIKGLFAAGEAGAIIAGATEHSAVTNAAASLAPAGVRLDIVPVGADGIVRPDAVEAALAPDVKLVAAMAVNNEIGTINPVADIAAVAHRHGALMLCDAVQAFGRMPIPAGPDLIAVTAHKIYGPIGIGALWVRDGVALNPLIHGGGQEEGMRSGTLSPALVAGFGAAARLAGQRIDADKAHTERLWQAARACLPGWTINGSAEDRYHGNMNIRRDGVDAARLLSECREVAFSLGSSCANGKGKPSHVLKAIGLEPQEARGSLRLGWGRYTTEQELVRALKMIDALAMAQLAQHA